MVRTIRPLMWTKFVRGPRMQRQCVRDGTRSGWGRNRASPARHSRNAGPNEAFAAQCLACTRPLEIEAAKLNVHGGAIALGHPIGASGARVLVTLLHALADCQLRLGLAALCLGGGEAVAMILERVA